MKKISLRLRFTLTASVFLFVSCTVLAFLSNFSANKMVEAIELQPSVAVQEGDVLFFHWKKFSRPLQQKHKSRIMYFVPKALLRRSVL